MDFVNSCSKKSYNKNNSSIEVLSNEVWPYRDDMFNINLATITSKQLEVLINIHKRRLEVEEHLKSNDFNEPKADDNEFQTNIPSHNDNDIPSNNKNDINVLASDIDIIIRNKIWNQQMKILEVNMSL